MDILMSCGLMDGVTARNACQLITHMMVFATRKLILSGVFSLKDLTITNTKSTAHSVYQHTNLILLIKSVIRK